MQMGQRPITKQNVTIGHTANALIKYHKQEAPSLVQSLDVRVHLKEGSISGAPTTNRSRTGAIGLDMIKGLHNNMIANVRSNCIAIINCLYVKDVERTL
jgi:hypothetical protein